MLCAVILEVLEGLQRARETQGRGPKLPAFVGVCARSTDQVGARGKLSVTNETARQTLRLVRGCTLDGYANL